MDGGENLLAVGAAGYGVTILPAKMVGSSPPGGRPQRLRLPAPGDRLRLIWAEGPPSDLRHNFLSVTNGATALAGK